MMPVLDADDMSALVAGGIVVVEGDSADELTELHRMSRRISGQYVDVLAAYARHAFQGRASRSLREQVEAALSGLTRLAEASDDQRLQGALEVLAELLPDSEARGGTRRRDFMRGLSSWVLDFAGLLEPADAERMRSMVSFEDSRLPLLDRLADVHGVGPKRLQRLYCAGLFTVDAVAGASTQDVVSVTGLPRPVAERVVAAAREFAEEERRSLVSDLRRRSGQLKDELNRLDGNAEAQRHVLKAAVEAMNEIRQAIAAFGEWTDKEDG
jgi:hypothetical protein